MNQVIQVSVLCLAYNHAKYIKKTLDSILSQKTNFKFEVIINDDASTDGTTNILKDYEKKYPELIKPIFHTENQYSQGIDVIGPLIESAKGKYIAFCECDDFYNDTLKLQKQFDFLENNNEYVAYIHSAWKVDESGEKKIGIRKPAAYKKKMTAEDIIDSCLENYSLNSLMVKYEAIYPLPDFYYLSTVGDIPIALTIAKNGLFYFDDTPMSSYRIGAIGSWNQRNKKNTKSLIKYYKSLIDMFNSYDIYTNFAYHQVISNKLGAINFWKSYWENPIEIFHNKVFRKYYYKLDIRTKIKLWLFSVIK